MKIRVMARPGEAVPLNYPRTKGVSVTCVMSPNSAIRWEVRENGQLVKAFRGQLGLERARRLAEGLRETAS